LSGVQKRPAPSSVLAPFETPGYSNLVKFIERICPAAPLLLFGLCDDFGSIPSNDLTIYCGFTLLVNSPHQEFRFFGLHLRHPLPFFFSFSFRFAEGGEGGPRVRGQVDQA
jgi:hypothetical protein